MPVNQEQRMRISLCECRYRGRGHVVGQKGRTATVCCNRMSMNGSGVQGVKIQKWGPPGPIAYVSWT